MTRKNQRNQNIEDLNALIQERQFDDLGEKKCNLKKLINSLIFYCLIISLVFLSSWSLIKKSTKFWSNSIVCSSTWIYWRVGIQSIQLALSLTNVKNSSRIITIQDNLLQNGTNLYDIKPYLESDCAKDCTIPPNLSLFEYLKKENSLECCGSMYVCLVISSFLFVYSYNLYRIDKDNQKEITEEESRRLFRKAFVS